MSRYTLSFFKGDEATGRMPGWQSFYTFKPELMLGFKGRFFSFKGGNIHEHHRGPRNTFYGEMGSSVIEGVFSDSPLENSVYKTIAIEGTHPWSVALKTDLQDGGLILAEWFVPKENTLFAYIRTQEAPPENASKYMLRAASGIGSPEQVDVITPGIEERVHFSVSPLIRIPQMVSVGDLVYRTDPITGEAILVGRIINIVRNLPDEENYMDIDISTGASIPGLPYLMSVKDATAESYGLLGHYCTFTMTNNSSESAELFAVIADTMKSYP